MRRNLKNLLYSSDSDYILKIKRTILFSCSLIMLVMGIALCILFSVVQGYTLMSASMLAGYAMILSSIAIPLILRFTGVNAASHLMILLLVIVVVLNIVDSPASPNWHDGNEHYAFALLMLVIVLLHWRWIPVYTVLFGAVIIFRASLYYSQAGIPAGSLRTYLIDHLIPLLTASGLGFSLTLMFRMALSKTEELLENEKKITERLKQTSSDLHSREEDLRLTLDSIGEGFITIDDAGRLKQINQSALQMIGKIDHDPLGKPLAELIRLRSALSGEELISRLLVPVGKNISSTLKEEGILKNRDGDEIRISLSASPFKGHNEHQSGMVVVFHDISREYTLQQQLNHSMKMEAAGQLAGGVAHDFNNMLGGIIGAAEALEDHLGQDEKELSQLILKSALQASRLTAKLLTFSRNSEFNPVESDVHAIIEDALSLLKHSLHKKISITPRLQAKHSVILCDAAQIQNAILNLCINAADAMSDGGELLVSTANRPVSTVELAAFNVNSPAGDYLVVRIKDDGHGIEKEVLERIFEPFYTTKEAGKGTGLGLSAVHGTVVAHKGVIQVESTRGQGTEFEILLPLSGLKLSDNESDDASERGATDDHRKPKGAVLVIDDEAVIRKTMRHQLERLGYDVLLAENGQEGVELYRESADRVLAVILDMVMPVMDGKEAFHKIREINPDARIIICSGYTGNASITELKECGLCAFLAKPFRREKLATLLQECIDKPQTS